MPKVNKPEPDFKLAISSEDMERVDPIVIQNMLLDRLDLDNPVRVDASGQDSTDLALAFSCKLIDAAMICDILRSEDRKAGDRPTRVYLRNGNGNWKRTSDNQVFIACIKGKTHLNPLLFGVKIDHEPLPTKAVTFGD